MFYLQDSRGYIGNDVVWWAKDGKGYTTDLRKAHIYTEDEAQKMHFARTSDIPWPKDYIDARTRPAVDMQYIKRSEALEGTGIEIVKPTKEKSERPKCHQCGSFMSSAQMWAGTCPKCGTDNRP